MSTREASLIVPHARAAGEDSPGLKASIVTVRSAKKQGLAARPDCADSPLGTSTATAKGASFARGLPLRADPL